MVVKKAKIYLIKIVANYRLRKSMINYNMGDRDMKKLG